MADEMDEMDEILFLSLFVNKLKINVNKCFIVKNVKR
tara:strand:- start:372 stop:482 length:111 start_codon:yes stop_codon:yes gene_type:complete